ncbi:GTP-binding protein [Rhodococcus triatomae]|uniref:Cobalamin biosynthesis protein CobW n=1 Tax=Rhodococcus triatomae TaxID=300028 RepID=A0A1G8EYG4_9NOCA|nr:GTP-binding protein [Rhodococcus triatomae]QNG19328.1 GTP-binding protein [Rhodococcus triatomae]QNG24759.1 GTP-binding protein [Rhodococcus triatomae]SDH74892.1 cobalamin biosynthesis protein CobW [Rhodococcus triatomae]
MARTRIPVVVVAGFLGSGKTTLLNHLLRNNRGVRVGVIVNDFGAINIDSMLVAGQVDSMVSLSNGCLCCAVDVSDMDEMLDRLAHPSSEIDVIVVEASGVAEPRNMIRLVLGSENPRVFFGGLVTVVDADQFGETLTRHPELAQHVGLADLVVLNKVDQVGDQVGEDVRVLLREFNDRAPIVSTSHGRVDPELLFDPGRAEPAPGEQLTLDQLLADPCDDHDHGADRGHGHRHLHSEYEAIEFESDRPLDPRELVAFLEQRPVGVFRVKGFVHFAVPGQSRKFEVQAVGPHIRFTGSRWEPGETRRTQLVLIGAGVDREAVAAGLERCVATEDGEAAADPNSMLGVHRYTVAV